MPTQAYKFLKKTYYDKGGVKKISNFYLRGILMTPRDGGFEITYT